MSDNQHIYLSKCKSILVKVGSAVLTNAYGLNLEVLNNLADQLARLKQSGHRVTLVSSGAVAAGRTTLAGTRHKVADMSDRQAAAAIGQSRLMRSYEDAFAKHEVICAQVLLTREDLKDRTRFLHVHQTFSRLLDWRLSWAKRGALTVPTTLLLASRDRIIDNGATTAAVQRLTDGKARVVTLEAAHTMDFEESPDEFLRALAAATNR